jgi:hypothetical protein
MKQCNTCNLTKNLDSFHKNKNCLDGRQYKCKLCVNTYLKAYYSQNKEQVKEKVNNYRQNNPTKISARKKLYRQNNMQKVKSGLHNWYMNNKSKSAETTKAYNKAHPAQALARCNKRRASRLNAIPRWLTKEDLLKIKEFYIEAKRLELLTGGKYHVDHIIPLQGEAVRGLHVPWNLQVIPAYQNIIKGNKI